MAVLSSNPNANRLEDTMPHTHSSTPNPSPREHLIALNAADRITRAALCRLASHLESWRHLDPNGPLDVLSRHAYTLGIPTEPLKRALELTGRVHTLAEQQLEQAERRNCHILTSVDAEYPSALLDHPLPPPVLYLRGTIPPGPSVAMVGSRKMNDYGRRAAELFAGRLAESGVTVVSGFARGIDTVAHRAAVQAKGGHTVAVLGCGLDIDYPRGNAQLAIEVAERGAMVSEFAFGVPPRRWHFPIRNRVIAGLADCTLVVQAAPRSGSLITAHLALELGRDVYAVPGSIFDELGQGTNDLIADGAIPARTPNDILEGLPLALKQQLLPFGTPMPNPQKSLEAPPPADFSPPETASAPPVPAGPAPKGFPGKVYAALPPNDSISAEDLATALETTVDRILAALLELELSGRIRRLPGPVYGR